MAAWSPTRRMCGRSESTWNSSASTARSRPPVLRPQPSPSSAPVQCSTGQYGTVQYSAVHNRAVQYGTVLYSTSDVQTRRHRAPTLND
eukprot:7010106-Pyramimonas_sp.AAC.1